MPAKKEVKEVFNIEILGYKKSEVDALVNTLSDRIEVLTKDVEFLKKELGKFNKPTDNLLKPIDK
jgi:cell division septum initiation protein DivIVA